MVEHDSDFGLRPSRPRLTVRFEGELDWSRLDELDRAVGPASSLNGVELIVDLTCVTFMDSPVIRWLLSSQENVRHRNGRLRVVATTTGALVKILGLTGLHDQIEVDLLPAPAGGSRLL